MAEGMLAGRPGVGAVPNRGDVGGLADAPNRANAGLVLADPAAPAPNPGDVTGAGLVRAPNGAPIAGGVLAAPNLGNVAGGAGAAVGAPNAGGGAGVLIAAPGRPGHGQLMFNIEGGLQGPPLKVADLFFF